jgi:hypothetical protein
MARWDMILERELVEQSRLLDLPRSHHGSWPLLLDNRESAQAAPINSRVFQRNTPKPAVQQISTDFQ